ncbi:MAG: hypothetical protein U9N51_07745, partial [Bacteroidota bacterium]|nr:hypothetical protein [Bacteroidota bacterium]
FFFSPLRNFAPLRIFALLFFARQTPFSFSLRPSALHFAQPSDIESEDLSKMKKMKRLFHIIF